LGGNDELTWAQPFALSAGRILEANESLKVIGSLPRFLVVARQLRTFMCYLMRVAF
jgi:hypothetical protein